MPHQLSEVSGRRWRPWVCGILALLALAAGPVRAAEPAPAPPLAVGASTDNYPYSYTDADGRVTGFAVELLDAVAARMNLRLQRVALPGMEERRRFAEGAFAIRQFHARTSTQELDAEYSAPVLIVRGSVFARKGEKRFRSLDDLRRLGLRVAAPPQGHSFALAEGFSADHLVRASSADCLRMLAAGEIDAALISRLTGLAQAQHLGIEGVEPVGPTLDGFTVRYCIATRRGDTALLGEVNEGLATLYQTGEYEHIYQKWFAHHDPASGFTPLQLVGYTTAALGLGLVVAIVALLRQRHLSRRLAAQAAELDESHTVLAEAQRFARVGHWRRALTPDTVSVWSEQTFEIFGLPPAGGVPTREKLTSLAIPAERPRWAEVLREAADHGTAYDFDITIETPAGERKVVHVRGTPVRDAAGRLTALFGTAQDVTAWRAAEDARRQSEQLLRVLYDNLPLAVTLGELRDGEWHLLVINEECLRRFRLEKMPAPGTRLRDLGQPPERVAIWAGLAHRCVQAGRTIRVDSRREEPAAEFVFTAIPLAAAPHPRCLMLTEDVTEQRQKDTEIAQSRRLRAIGELVGGIAHEFNNLLTPIALNAEMLEAEWAHEPELAGQLKGIVEAAKRSAELTRRLLTFGRKTERRVAALDLRTLIDADLELIRRTIDRRIEVACRLPEGLPPLHLDGGDVHQVLLNLLFNARDTLQDKLAQSPPAGWSPQIEIEAVLLAGGAAQPIAARGLPPPAHWIRLSVRDNGLGMTRDVVERVFEPFYTTKEVGRGTGLGLATVWHILTELGGRIDVESRPGHGSVFHVALPVRPASDAAPAAHAEPSPARNGSALRILLVEDEEAVAQVVRSLLRRQGHVVTHAADGLSGWNALSAEPAAFDLAIFDLNMPGLHGKELVRRARALPFGGPIVITSGRIPDTERAELLAAGADAMLDKPFSIEELRRTLADVQGRAVR